MTPMDTAHTTRIFGAPENWDEKTKGDCKPAPVVDEYGNGRHVMTIFWRVGLRERIELLLGRPLALTIHGDELPPVMVYVAKIKRKHYRRQA